jgi:hypothetical protein
MIGKSSIQTKMLEQAGFMVDPKMLDRPAYLLRLP